MLQISVNIMIKTAKNFKTSEGIKLFSITFLTFLFFKAGMLMFIFWTVRRSCDESPGCLYTSSESSEVHNES